MCVSPLSLSFPSLSRSPVTSFPLPPFFQMKRTSSRPLHEREGVGMRPDERTEGEDGLAGRRRSEAGWKRRNKEGGKKILRLQQVRPQAEV